MPRGPGHRLWRQHGLRRRPVNHAAARAVHPGQGDSVTTMLLHHFFDQTAARWPDKVALVCGEQRHTYRQLRVRVDRLATYLQQRGIQRGDRVALFMDNTVELVVGIFAALQVGAVFMPISPLTKQAKLVYLLKDSGASALLTQPSLASVYQPALAQSPQVHTLWHAGLPDDSPPSALPWAEPDLIDQDLASIIYTSGTTGEP